MTGTNLCLMGDQPRQAFNPCSQANCAAEGHYRPVLKVFTNLQPDEPIHITLSTRYCRKHKRKARITDFIHTSIWSSIVEELEKTYGSKPLPAKTGLDWIEAEAIYPDVTILQEALTCPK